MTPEQMLEGLVAAEMGFAHFNALRTSDSDDTTGIRQGVTANCLYLRDPTRPASAYFNRAVGRTTAVWPDSALSALPAGLAAIELMPAQVNVGLSAQLVAAGYLPAYTLCYLGLLPGSVPATAWDVQRLGAADTDVFFDLLEAQDVPFPPARRERKRGFYCTDGFRAYVARTPDGRVVAGATMFVQDDAAYLGNAFTLPGQRHGGAHAALLAARLNDARELGLAVVYTDVEHGSQSHLNCERAGFRVLTINTVWCIRTPQ